MNYDIQCYIQIDGGSLTNTRTLWSGMYLLDSKNIDAYGKPKNIITENYAEANGLKVSLPTTLKREATDVTLKLMFIDTDDGDRYAQYESFMSYISNKKFYWFDTVRFRRVRLLCLEKTEPTESFKGNIPYLTLDLKVKNINGYSEPGTWFFKWGEGVCERVDNAQNGMRRCDVVTFLILDVEMNSFNLRDAFVVPGPERTTYGALTSNELANLDSAEYNQRLVAFCGYVLDAMNSLYRYFDIDDISEGARISDPTNCPIQ